MTDKMEQQKETINLGENAAIFTPLNSWNKALPWLTEEEKKEWSINKRKKLVELAKERAGDNWPD